MFNAKDKKPQVTEPIVRPNELLRIKLPQTPMVEIRIRDGKSWFHVIPSNKDQITLVGGERRLRRV